MSGGERGDAKAAHKPAQLFEGLRAAGLAGA